LGWKKSSETGGGKAKKPGVAKCVVPVYTGRIKKGEQTGNKVKTANGKTSGPMTLLPLAPKSSPGLAARLRSSPLPPLWGIVIGQNTHYDGVCNLDSKVMIIMILLGYRYGKFYKVNLWISKRS
jgi:hypothetical protein